MSERTSTPGIGFVGLLTIAFIILKLTGVITWSWLWVLSPIWITACVMALIIACILFVWAMWGRDES